MIKLPFKTEPKKVETVTVGDEVIGTLLVPRLGDLSPNERVYLREHTKDSPDLRVSAAKVARLIASQSGLKLKDVFEALARGDNEFLSDYMEEAFEFQELMEKTTAHRRLVIATAILKYRLVPEWSLENTGDANFIHPKLVQEVADFAQKEESGWLEPKSEAITDEQLGNSQTGPELAAA